MKKSNLITLLSLCLLIVGVIVFMVLSRDSTKKPEADSSSPTQSSLSDSQPSDTASSTSTTAPSGTEKSSSKPVAVSMDNTLFIGDSRTVGLMEYAQLEQSDFFCSVGMSVFNIHKKPVSVPGVGKLTLTELLDNKKYDRIYVMLGLNEMGYEFNSIVAKYDELIKFIQGKNPNADIVIQANLHITKSRSDGDKVYNNNAINKLNAALSKLADNKRVFYIDANTLFDDANGALAADKTSDNTHLYAKYYKEWGSWIVKQTAALIEEE